MSTTLSILDPHWNGLLSDTLLLPCGLEMLQLCICRTSPFTCSSSSSWDRCWDGPTQSPGSGPGWYLSWPACELSHTHTTRASSPALPGLALPMHQLARDRASSSTLMPSGLILATTSKDSFLVQGPPS